MKTYSEMANSTAPTSAEMVRTVSFLSPGTRKSTAAVIIGITMRASRICPCSTLTPHRVPDYCDDDHAQHHGQRVVRQLAGLLELQHEAHTVGDLAGAVDARVVDDSAVEVSDDLGKPEDDVVDRPLVEV